MVQAVTVGVPSWNDLAAGASAAAALNVRDFGASGNSFTDDTAAIQAALDKAAAGPVKRVMVPSGTYLVSHFLTIQSGVEFCGDGVGSIILASSVSLPFTPDTSGGVQAGAVIYVGTTAVRVTICNLWVQGQLTNPSLRPSSTTFGIRFAQGSSDCQLLNCRLTSHSWSGAFIGGSRHLIQGNDTEANGVDGLEIAGTDLQVIANRSFNDGFYDSSPPGTSSFELVNTCQRTVVIGNVSVNCNWTGIQISTASGTNPTGLVIDSNSIYNAGQRGISDGGTIGTRIVNNLIDTTRGVASFGNGLDLGNTTQFVVANNRIVNTDSLSGTGRRANAINIEGTTNDGIVSGNICTNNWVGIGVADPAASTGIIILSGNHCYGNPGADYVTSTTGTLLRTTMNSFGEAFQSNIPGTLDLITPPLAGTVGEYIVSDIPAGSAVPLTSAVQATITSIALGIGDWDVSGVVVFHLAATTSYTLLQGAVSSVSSESTATVQVNPTVPSNATDITLTIPVVRLALTSAFTCPLLTIALFTVSTMSAYGIIRARRVR